MKKLKTFISESIEITQQQLRKMPTLNSSKTINAVENLGDNGFVNRLKKIKKLVGAKNVSHISNLQYNDNLVDGYRVEVETLVQITFEYSKFNIYINFDKENNEINCSTDHKKIVHNDDITQLKYEDIKSIFICSYDDWNGRYKAIKYRGEWDYEDHYSEEQKIKLIKHAVKSMLSDIEDEDLFYKTIKKIPIVRDFRF